MSNSLFPSIHGLGWGGMKVPITKTVVQEAASGREVRVQLMQNPLYKWVLPFNYLWDGRYNQNDFQTLLGFILSQGGMYDSFLYDDPTDDTKIQQQINVGDGTHTVFAVLRSVGGFSEPVDWIQAVSNVSVGGTGTTNFTIQQAAGTITFGFTPGNGAAILADITYYWRVRFDTDSPTLTRLFYQIWEAKQIELVRVKT